MERRDLFRILGASAAGATAGFAQHAHEKNAAASASPAFFTADERRCLEAFCDTLLPADAEAGGALEGRVPHYIETSVHYAEAATKASWKEGLAAVDALSVQSFGKPLADLTEGGRGDVLAILAANETKPATEAERFFARAKAITIDAWFQSGVGMRYAGYKGNTGVTSFRGCKHDHQTA